MPLSRRRYEQELRRQGFEFLRKSGKHELWAHPDGRRVSLPHHDNSDVVSHTFMKRLKQGVVTR